MRERTAWLARVALVLLLLALCSASVLLWRHLENDKHKRLNERLDYQTQAFAQRLESNLHLEAESLNRIARLWNQLGRLPRESWEEEARQALHGFAGYQSIQWVDADLQMRWLVPIEGNEAAKSFRLLPQHPNYELAMQARRSGEQRFSNSFDLVQGGRGFILYTPLFIQDDQGKRTFDGFLQGVFRVEPLMDELLRNRTSGEFSIRLLQGDDVLYSRDQSDAVPELAQFLPLQLFNNHNFRLQLSPTRSLLRQLNSPLPQVVLGASLAISLLLVAALFLALENARRASALLLANRLQREAARQREVVEQHLRESREQLQLVIDLTDSSHDALFILDTQSRELLHMNRATHTGLGYPAAEFAQLLREHPERLVPGYHEWLGQVRKAQREGSSRIFQRQMRRRDGSAQPAEINTQLVQRNGREYLIGVSRDNSERLLLEARLQRLSQLDGLTGLYNRRFFDQQLQSEWRRLRRIGAPIALLMLDIDHFKTYNDALGHLAGDDALRKVAAVLQECLQREGDVACRYGGEEFAIILANTSLEGGEYVATQVHERIAALAIAHPQSPLQHLTLSIGLAVAEPVGEEQPAKLIAHSDKALYRAKHAGRNRTCVWDGAESAEP